MKNRVLIIPLLTILIALSVGFLFAPQSGEGFRILGIQANDGTAIQVYRPLNRYTDFYYPQDCKDIPSDRCLLPNEEFYIFIDFLDHDPTPRNVSLLIYQSETKLIQKQDPESGEWVSQNITDFTKLASNITLTLSKGQNEFGDTRYAIKLVDVTVWSDLKPTDAKEKIVIKYLDKKIDFWHRTDYDLVPITLTRGDQNSFGYFQAGIALLAIIVGVLIGGFLTSKTNRVYPPIPLSSIFIAFLIFVITVLINILTSSISNTITGTNEDILRAFAGVRPEYVSVTIAILISFWIPSAFRNRSMGKALVLRLNIPYEDRKSLFDKLVNRDVKDLKKRLKDVIPDGDWEELHFYTTWRGKKIYTHNPDSVFSFITDLIFGGIKLDWEATTVIPAGKKEETVKQNEIILTTDFKEFTKSIIPKKYQYPMYGALFALSLISLIATILFRELMFVSVFFAVSLVLIFAYNNLEDQREMRISPMGRNASAAIYDALVVNEMETDYDNILVENTDLKRSAKFEISARENAARYESFLLFASTTFQDDFTENLPKTLKILDSVGVNMDNSGKIARRESKDANNENEEHTEDNTSKEQTK